MRVLVTGASGFVGRHLVPQLARVGHEVAPYDRRLDVVDAAAVEAALEREKPDAIVHLAAISSEIESRAAPRSAYRVNYLGTRSVLEATARHAVGARVLIVGSASEYGSVRAEECPLVEEAPLRPRSPYARTKAAADLLGGAYAARGLDVVRVRAFNHTGPGQREQFVASSFARQVAEIERGIREPRLGVGNLESVREFLSVEDVVEAYVRLLDPSVPAGVYNVAAGVGLPIGRLLTMLFELSDVEPRVEVEPARLRPTDYSIGDGTRLRQATGWSPGVPLERTLAQLLDHWRKSLSAS